MITASALKIIAGCFCGLCGLAFILGACAVVIVLRNPPGGNPRS